MSVIQIQVLSSDSYNEGCVLPENVKLAKLESCSVSLQICVSKHPKFAQQLHLLHSAVRNTDCYLELQFCNYRLSVNCGDCISFLLHPFCLPRIFLTTSIYHLETLKPKYVGRVLVTLKIFILSLKLLQTCRCSMGQSSSFVQIGCF
ncbi:hypothetical protein L596_002377 [Steinernema carpocapsae]|uniref:Uncharacterized protein n=1 Tax=Steinernema carpocapsae TaxID=34508 RepID=A0A4U8UPJ6_STECR|nr:hypothetical protein L596_002377 [Steinernema carpocapsae]